MKLIFSSLQWMIFLIAGSIVAPIAIADLYGLTMEETAGFVQRTMFVLGAASILQGLFGHRLPINEGPAGLWWGVFTIYASLSSALFSSNIETLQALQGGLIGSGIVFIMLSAFNLIQKIAALFTPVVLGSYLLLLVLQLSGSFLNGMLGVGYRQEGIDLPISLFSLFLIIFTIYLSNHRLKWINQYSILISLFFGWILFSIFGFAKPVHMEFSTFFQFPELFAFGYPVFKTELLLTSVFITLLLITNMIASIQLVRIVLQKEDNDKKRVKRAGFISGINQLLGGGFAAIGPVPISGAAGFIATTKITSIVPFLLGAGFVVISSFSPQLMALFASLPAPIGYAVTFVVFANMIRLAFSEFDREKDKERTRLVIGISLLAGVGVMFVPAHAYEGIHPLAAAILNNGLVLGSLTAIVVDQITRKKKGK